MRYFLINKTTPQEIRASLSAFGECVLLPAFDLLPFPVCHHPDMLMASLDGVFFVHREYEKGQEILNALGVPFFLSAAEVGMRYPQDVALNCFSVGNFLFAKKDAVSESILLWAEQNGKNILPVSQGYTKCSAAVAGGAVASADQGIVKAAERAGIPALLLPPHPIGIEVYDTGFIGGACGLLHENTLGFFGSVEKYPSYTEIKHFFSTVGVEIVSLSDAPLFDLGGMISVEV